MSDLNNFSDEELKRELKKRKEEAKKQAFKMNEDPDLTGLKNYAEEQKESYLKDGEPTKDAEHYMYEEVMKAFYGKDFFDKIMKMHK